MDDQNEVSLPVITPFSTDVDIYRSFNLSKDRHTRVTAIVHIMAISLIPMTERTNLITFTLRCIQCEV